MSSFVVLVVLVVQRRASCSVPSGVVVKHAARAGVARPPGREHAMIAHSPPASPKKSLTAPPVAQSPTLAQSSQGDDQEYRVTSCWGRRMSYVGALLCAAVLLLAPRTGGAEPLRLSVTAQGNDLELSALESALVQQFAGEPLTLILWNSSTPSRSGGDVLGVQANLGFRPGGVLVQLAFPTGAERNEFVTGTEVHSLSRTVAIIISHLVLRSEHLTAVPPPAAPDVTPSAKDLAPPARTSEPTTQSSASRLSSEHSSHATVDDFEDPDPSRARPLRPVVSLTGFGLSAILVGPAIVSASAFAPPPDPPSGTVRTTDETEQLEYVRLRTEGQNRLTAALVTSSVVLGATSIVLATAFTDWSRRPTGVSLVTQPGGVGCQFFSDF